MGGVLITTLGYLVNKKTCLPAQQGDMLSCSCLLLNEMMGIPYREFPYIRLPIMEAIGDIPYGEIPYRGCVQGRLISTTSS